MIIEKAASSKFLTPKGWHKKTRQNTQYLFVNIITNFMKLSIYFMKGVIFFVKAREKFIEKFNFYRYKKANRFEGRAEY